MSGRTPEHSGRSVGFYVGVAVVLALITLIELGPLFGVYQVPSWLLVILSSSKFFAVVAFFMHLWDDAAVFSRVFLVPLAGAALMVVALMAMFHTFEPSSGDDPFVIQERYAENWNRPCDSWMESPRTHRRYCGSPPIARERLAQHAATPAGPAGGPPPVDLSGKSEADQLALLRERGEQLYTQNCSVCHQPDGAGVAGVYPPIAGSDYLADGSAHIGIVVNGLSGPIVVNGRPYNGVMPAFGTLNDYNIAAMVTYERTSWGNDLGLVLPEAVREGR